MIRVLSDLLFCSKTNDWRIHAYICCRTTLFLGPPGCGKTTLLKALPGKLSKSLKVAGEVSYNGYKLEEFIPQKTSAYISQNDIHIPEMTVRETLDFSARCQGVGSRAEIMIEVSRREKQSGIVPDPDADIYMKAISVEGQKTTLQTDYILKYSFNISDIDLPWLDICAYTLIGDAMRRGISGGQKKRLTTGKIVYHGPCSHVLEFFEDCGFRCSERIGVADFLQEVISKKDPAQYCTKPNNLAITFLLTCFPRNSRNRLLVPISLFSALIWTSLTYYVIGYSPEAGRFFLQFILFLALHLAATSMFCFVASVFRAAVASTTAGSLFVLFVLLFSGFIIPKSSMPTWLKWGFWVSPLTYGEVGLALNEFLAPRWQKVSI
ncbi:Pleiotropic drug resistance protein 3 [Camellia lanceoleosa]|uniref:Pleiotropic drug resistance protein 3 n=1 Tax=Camellia lanceoleosa TaxID=1840588 RepID=A0ACC0IN43_9ERIC|nr:Pleiotropic drug resistance protein 3 [Camellia lanceoleosa]